MTSDVQYIVNSIISGHHRCKKFCLLIRGVCLLESFFSQVLNGFLISFSYNLGHMLVDICEIWQKVLVRGLAESAYFRSASPESDNKWFSAEGLGTRLPLGTLTCLKPMTIWPKFCRWKKFCPLIGGVRLLECPLIRELTVLRNWFVCKTSFVKLRSYSKFISL